MGAKGINKESQTQAKNNIHTRTKKEQAVKNAEARDKMEKKRIDNECGVYESEEEYFENLLKDDKL